VKENIWFCKIGGKTGDLRHGADLPMRTAIRHAFREITGSDEEFLFSGWGGSLTEPERAVVENRKPRMPVLQSSKERCSKCDEPLSPSNPVHVCFGKQDASTSVERSLVRHVCTAYESGFGHGVDARDLLNPYVPMSSAWEAYEYGREEGAKRRSRVETSRDPELQTLVEALLWTVNDRKRCATCGLLDKAHRPGCTVAALNALLNSRVPRRGAEKTSAPPDDPHSDLPVELNP
jgi:hypothetical protein